MPFDLQQVSTQVRTLVEELSPGIAGLPIPRVNLMIKTALQLWAREAFKDPQLRQQFKSKVAVTVTAGEVDLSDYIDGTTSRMYLPDISKANVYLTSSGEQCFWVGNRELLSHKRVGSDTDRVALYLEGTDLYTRNTDGSLTSLTGVTIDITVPVFPADVTEIPVTQQQPFIEYAAEYIRGKIETRAAEAVT